MKRLAALCLASLMIAACHPGTETNGPVLSYTDAFIMAPIGGRDVTMGGIEITPSGADVRLVAVSSDAAETVEMHTMAMEDGTMKMRPVESFEISDGETLDLDRGGDHLMMFGASETLTAGETANLTLTFETADGETLTLEAEAEIRALGE